MPAKNVKDLRVYLPTETLPLIRERARKRRMEVSEYIRSLIEADLGVQFDVQHGTRPAGDPAAAASAAPEAD